MTCPVYQPGGSMARLLQIVLAIPTFGTCEPDTRDPQGLHKPNLRWLIPIARMIPLDLASPLIGMAGIAGE